MSDPVSKLLYFCRDEKGAVTIEFTVLFLPTMMIFVFFIDASALYFTHSEMYRTARDIARRISTQQFTTREQAENYAVQHLHLGERTYFLDPSFGADIRVSISIPIKQAAIFGAWFTPVIGRDLVVVASMRKEPLK